MKSRYLLLCFFLPYVVQAQINQPPASSADARRQGFELREDMRSTSMFKEVPFKNVGPTVFSGRVVDLEVHPLDPSIFYVAYASGGLWKTVNNGTTFTPIFDHEMVMTIGDFAVNWQENIIWLGTGESNSSRSSYAGNGVYQSHDDGKTWQHIGLSESHHIGRIMLHPEDKDVAWVAALGHLYSSNEERGIFVTEDAGKTWNKTLYVNDRTGAADIVLHPSDPDILFASTWEKSRSAWNFEEAGAGSGIYRSDDGGITWTPCTTGANGFPSGTGTGRIGLTAMEAGNTVHLYALLDNYNRRPSEETEGDDLVKK